MTKKTKSESKLEPKIELELVNFEKKIENEEKQSKNDNIKNIPLDWSKPNGGL